MAKCFPRCTNKADRGHTWGESRHSSQHIAVQLPSFPQKSDKDNEFLIFNERQTILSPLYFCRSFSCLGWLVQSRRCYQEMWSSHDQEFSPVSMATEGSYVAEQNCQSQLQNRLISIKVLVQEEVLEAFRSAGSCATEGQSKRVIAVISQELCLFYKLAKKLTKRSKILSFSGVEVNLWWTFVSLHVIKC